MSLVMPLWLSAVLAGPGAGATPSQAEAALWTRLEERIAAVEHGLDGVLGLSVRDLTANRSLERRAQQPFPTASTIKLAVLYELYRRAEEGTVDLGEITRPPVPRVGGGGILQALSDRVSLTWHDLAVLMMVWSDNEATNRLIERVGRENVNRRLAESGLAATRLRRNMMDLEAARRGDENVSTPGDLRALLELLREGRGLAPARAADLLALARIPENGSRFRAALPEGVSALSKSGELEGVRCEVALVELTRRPYAAAIMTTFLRRDADGEQAIREISAVLWDTFERLDRASPLGRVISER